MKVEVKEVQEKKDIKFPCLMRSTSGLIILAIGIKDSDLKGTVLFSITHTLGFYSESWNRDSFVPFNGSVTLSND